MMEGDRRRWKEFLLAGGSVVVELRRLGERIHSLSDQAQEAQRQMKSAGDER